MKQPSILVRIAGTPLIACLSVTAAAVVIYGGYEGQLEWWLALAAVGAVFRTLSAVRAVRRYKAWRGEWEAMGQGGAPPPPAETPQRPNPQKRATLLVAALILMPMVSSLPAIHDNLALLRTLQWTWGLVALYCLFRVLGNLWRRAGSLMRHRSEARSAKCLDDPITLAVGAASGCPSRASAQRNLPDYCVQLMRNGD
jgi:hypothetical protein